MKERSVAHGMFTIERSYRAPPAKVFNAFSDAAIKRKWFVEGGGWEIESYEADFCVGGTEKSRFRYQGGPPITNDTTYQDIVPNERIIAYYMTIDGAPISASLVTMEFRPEGSGTRLVFTEQGAFLDRHDDIKAREDGTRGLLEALGKYVD